MPNTLKKRASTPVAHMREITVDKNGQEMNDFVPLSVARFWINEGQRNLEKKPSVMGTRMAVQKKAVYSKVLIMWGIAHTDVLLSLENQNSSDDKEREWGKDLPWIHLLKTAI